MNLKAEWKKLAWIISVFLLCFYLPVGVGRFDNAVSEALSLTKWYAREHVLLCLVPAFFIAGAIGVFVSQGSVMKYLGPKANKVLAYGVASVSGTILAVCSCTVLPLFAGIYRMGAGLGPAVAFLYSGPAINILAIIMTARILGMEMGIARAVGAILFSIVIGVLMHLIYRKEEIAKAEAAMAVPQAASSRPLWKNAVFFAAMVLILVAANWARSGDVRAFFLCCPGGLQTYAVEGKLLEQTDTTVTVVDNTGTKHVIPVDQFKGVEPIKKNPVYEWISQARWGIVAAAGVLLAAMCIFWFTKPELIEWVDASWTFAKQILPLLLIGVLAAGFFLGRPGKEGIIPNIWVEKALGGNGLGANLFAAVAGAFMYFATLTEVPILQGLMGSGMGKGPALALLLAGPALSLPNMLVIRSIMGTQKTVVYVLLVIVMAAISGMLFGAFF
ncbi:MAG TPA: permease [Anaerohalosphaeraceae bacterium]|nr:permease [Phycisphaerae bacterium]HOK94580.1 permease [Anaerohalosphaeraceae bacterium]HOL31517.1 permease [Anaerohalosphaeraceae bacterium]HOM75560.1 permease [Anaerohalosphaeraceae bacterium]HPC64342.1 permease [Anaerohalosphaeraceae bacterium]